MNYVEENDLHSEFIAFCEEHHPEIINEFQEVEEEAQLE